ncbi:MAG: tRNA uridine-5-carboxymethylaminomethyl(34) synthesis GTPase MnmE [Endomicrobia bacterium]|nr:tRNA uridine-5-carboxymethylaminomethyl(34) synthesis GTPase MnmE [Endomicrobiia bacterium]
MQYIYQTDTIVAVSTPLGFGGLGIVRMSGKKSIEIAEKIFMPKNKNKVISQLKTYTTHLGYIVENSNILDEVLLTIMRSPHSYTCEDVVEFSCHGGPAILKKVVELCIAKGARLAEPGEFTKRAFINGRIDLSQAEAVSNLIYAHSELQTKIFANSLLGSVKRNIENLVKLIEEIISDIEVGIEYPQEDDVNKVNIQSLNNKIINVNERIDNLISNSQKIFPILRGINISIVGKVNVGKSSLLNVLVSYDRAIVSEIPGTTRDTISELIDIRGVPFRIVDTAGIRQHCQDIIEKTGISRTKEAIKQSNIILFLLDGSNSLTEDDFVVADILHKEITETDKKNVLILINKKDKPLKIFEEKERLTNLLRNFSNNEEFILISCVTKEGIDILQEKLYNLAVYDKDAKVSLFQDVQPTEFVVSMRQLCALQGAKKQIQCALQKCIKKEPELVSEDLKEATKFLQQIVGGDVTEDILNNIFSNFCVGK